MTERASLREQPFRSHKVAALYVQKDGAYFGVPDVEPWDEERDARLYDGPHPVVAHPPCNHWCQLAAVNAARYETFEIGNDGGCFEAALRAVRTCGGVLEHPAYSLAWPAFELPRPQRGSWQRALGDPGWVTEVTQAAYGHPARKLTWLYYVGPPPPALDWRDVPGDAVIGGGINSGECVGRRKIGKREASATPQAFRELLLSLAFARDLQHPDVGDTSSRSYGPETLAFPDGLTDGLTPCLLGSGTPRGGAAYPGQRLHLAGGRDGVAETLNGLRGIGIVQRDGDAEALGLGAESVVVARCLGEFGVGHSGNLPYHLVLCQVA